VSGEASDPGSRVGSAAASGDGSDAGQLGRDLSRREMGGALAGLAVVFGTLAVFDLLQGGPEQLSTTGRWLGDAVKWAQTGAVLLILRYGQGKPVSWIGIEVPRWKDLGLAVLTGVAAVLAGSVLAGALLGALGTEPDLSTLTFLRSLPFLQKVFVVVTAGITEELLYRAYAIEAIEAVTGSTTLAVVVSTAVFVGLHVPYWGLATGVGQALSALVLAGAYVWRRNLAVPAGAHILVDALGVFT